MLLLLEEGGLRTVPGVARGLQRSNVLDRPLEYGTTVDM